MIRLTYDPELVEEALLLMEARLMADQARAFRRERDKIYEIADAERRHSRFRSFHMDWFTVVGLGRVVERTVAERPIVATRLAVGRVVRAIARADEGADLVDRTIPGLARPQPMLVLRVRPSSLVEPESLEGLLRHELLHVADMLDPVFGYERALPSSDEGPAHDTRLRDRYRVLWDVTIDGRLSRDGFGNEPARVARWQEFASAFALSGARGRQAFDAWFDCRQPTHRALVAFITPACA